MNHNPYLLFGGDIAPTGLFADLLCTSDTFFDPSTFDLTSNSIATFANLELPVTSANVASEKSGPALTGEPRIVYRLKQLGFDCLFLANNHIMDFGESGLLETAAVCREVGIATIGAGRNLKEASMPYSSSYGRTRIKVINIGEEEFGAATSTGAGYCPLDVIHNLSQLTEARASADIVIVSLHAGLEYFPLPRPNLQRFARFLVDQGADAVICHHTHINSASEVYNDCPIYYGIGNLMFNVDKPNASWEHGFWVKLFIDESTKRISGFESVPYRQSLDVGGLRALEGGELGKFHEDVRILNSVLLDEDKYLERWNRFCASKEREYATLLYFPVIGWPISLLQRIPFIKNLLMPRSRAATRLNLIRCPSHAEILQQIHVRRLSSTDR